MISSSGIEAMVESFSPSRNEKELVLPRIFAGSVSDILEMIDLNIFKSMVLGIRLHMEDFNVFFFFLFLTFTCNLYSVGLVSVIGNHDA